MTPETFEKIKTIIQQVKDLAPSQQAEHVKNLCQNDQELVSIIMDMLEAQESTLAEAIEQPAILKHIDKKTGVEELPELIPGTTIKSYTIIKSIGKGGMGHVYAAQQKFPAERQVALKLIRKSPNHHLLLREIQILASLNHPNIATLYEINTTSDGKTFIAMELVNGSDLLSWHHENQLTKQQRLELFLQLCEGISYAHERGIIHCDIKPSNVLVTQINGSPVVKIIDFGISQFRDDTIETDSISGTPTYMAPEVLHRNSQTLVDIRRDIYSLGVLFQKLMAEDLDSKDLQFIADKATAEQASDRYAAVATLASDILGFQQQLPITARPHTLLYTATLFIKRRLGVVLFTLALVATVIAGYFAQARQAKVATEQAIVAQNARIEAEELSTFLTELFNVANPEKGRETAVTAQELLNNAKNQLLGIEQPTISDARFMHTIGSILIRMGQYDDAEEMIEKSIEIKKHNLPENDDEIISDISQLGLIYRKKSDYINAENTLLKSINLLKSKDHINNAQLAFAHNHLGNVYARTHQPKKAIEQHLKAIKLRTYLDDRKHLADSYNNIGVIYRQEGDYKKAADFMNKALTIYLEVYESNHPFIAAIKHNLSYIEEQQFNWIKAEQLLLEAIDTWRTSYGLNHSNTLLALKNLALYYQRRMRFSETIPVLTEVIEHLDQENQYEELANYYSYLGKSHADMNDPNGSIQAHNSSLNILNNKPIKDKTLIVRLHYRFAESLIQLKQFDKAEVEIAHALKEFDPAVMELYLLLHVKNLNAKIKFNQNKTADAEKIHLEVIASSSEQISKIQQQKVIALKSLGIINRLNGDLENSLLYLESALELNNDIYFEDHKNSGIIQGELGRTYYLQNHHSLANKHLFKAQSILEKALPANHPDLLALTAFIKTQGIKVAQD